MKQVKHQAQFLAHSGAQAMPAAGVGRAAASKNNNISGRMALATATDVAATFFFSLFVQMLPL